MNYLELLRPQVNWSKCYLSDLAGSHHLSVCLSVFTSKWGRDVIKLYVGAGHLSRWEQKVKVLEYFSGLSAESQQTTPLRLDVNCYYVREVWQQTCGLSPSWVSGGNLTHLTKQCTDAHSHQVVGEEHDSQVLLFSALAPSWASYAGAQLLVHLAGSFLHDMHHFCNLNCLFEWFCLLERKPNQL